jgi:hypothetical protein
MVRKIYVLLLILLIPCFLWAELPHKESSVLATGRWYKLAVVKRGIHKITWSDMVAMGIDPTTVQPENLRIYGNGAGMLPELNSAFRFDDLRENTLLVSDGSDGSFDEGDYLLFFGEPADKWSFDYVARQFIHASNYYSDTSYYFLTADLGPGKRIRSESSTTLPPTNFVRRSDDFTSHELDQRNLIRSGRIWYGEAFTSEKNSYDIDFYLPDIDSASALQIRSYVAAKSPATSFFSVYANGVKQDSIQVDYTEPDNQSVYAKFKQKKSFVMKPVPEMKITLSYHLPTSNSLGWLNYLDLSFVRALVWRAPQMGFRDVNSVGAGKIAEFKMEGATAAIQVWDLTNKEDICRIETTFTDSTSLLTFRLPTDTLREFFAFDGSEFLAVKFCGPVENQNLHALQPASLIIITHPLFLTQANQLADFHRNQNGTTTLVVTTDQVFNEFGCGRPDITAIRDFMKMLYDRGTPTGSQPDYLLLFGDGSYDPKNRIPGNNNLVPTFQSTESLKFVGTYVTDDYYGIMGDSSGQESNGRIDIGIGRFPVTTVEQAQIMVDKIVRYSTVSAGEMANWRNEMVFVADDENDNLHMHQAEQLVDIVEARYPAFNINKIYFDAYKMIKIPAGSRFPDVNPTINDAVDKGALILNYTGHGGEDGWSYEKCLTIADIESWTNFNRLPVFVTATCEFSRFDNPERFTAGEMVILHPKGGAIALYSTTRLALATSNFQLDTSFFTHLMDRDAQGAYLKMGDLIRLSKNNNKNNNNIRNFVLLGDPAQSIAFPKVNIRTVSINNEAVNEPVTTLGLSTVTVKGQVEDQDGSRISSFNGNLSAKVYDKEITNTTLGNTPGDTYPENFQTRSSLLYSGSASVVNGEFTYSFVMPLDIALQFGAGKLSHYACDLNQGIDASGYSDRIIIGGRDPAVDPVNQGPAIGLYLDNKSFVSGGKTGKSPVLMADLSDTNGINYLGLGIGHEIVATLDGNMAHQIVLNDYYVQQVNSFTRGSLSYPYTGLSTGFHTLTLKAWDMFNNSSERSITFYVSDQPQLTVTNIINAPNPLFTHTWFRFEQQQYTGGLDVTIRISDINGRIVNTITHTFTDSIEIPEIYWDGTDANGHKLSSGIYPYKIMFKGKNGSYSEASQKVVIIR